MLLVLVLPQLLPPGAAQATSAIVGGCDGPVCSWVAGSSELPPDVSWTLDAGEVAADVVEVEGLSVRIERAGRSGTFMLVSSPVEASTSGAFSVRMRSEGDLGRFAFLLREEGYPGWPEDGPVDTVLFHAPAGEWTFASWPWEPRRAGTTHVRIMLRGELAEGEATAIAFERPYFGPDGARWIADGEDAPFAHGPRAERRFATPGTRDVRVERSDGTISISAVVPLVDPSVAFDAIPSPTLPGGVRLVPRVESSYHPDGITNGNFSEGMRGWRLAEPELGIEATARVVDGALQLDVPRPSRDGTLWVHQSVRVEPGVELELTWRAADDRSVAAYAVVVLDADGTRHERRLPSAGPAGGGGAIRFVPKSNVVDVQLRIVATAGVPTHVAFDDVTLSRPFDLVWTVDGQTHAQSGAPFADLPMDRRGARTVALDARDDFGASARAERTLPEAIPGESVELRFRERPTVAIIGRTVWFDASPSGATSVANVLATATPWESWRLDDEEAPDRAVLAVAGPELAISSRGFGETFGAGAIRHVRLPSVPTAFDLSFGYRTEGAVERVQAIGRFHRTDGAIVAEVRANFTPSEGWHTGTLRMPPAPDAYETLVVSLRGVFTHGGAGRATFRDASLAPGIDYEWSIGDFTSRGPVAEFTPQDPGLEPWSLRVITPGGLRLFTESRLVILRPVPIFPTLAGGVAAAWPADLVPGTATFILAGPQTASASGPAGAVETEAFEPGTYSLVVQAPGATPVEAGRAEIRDRSGLPPAFALPPAARGSSWDVALPLPNPGIETAVLEVRSPAGQEFSVPLGSTGEDGRRAGAWRVPAWAVPGTFEASLRLRDSKGAEIVVPVGAFDVAVTPGRPEGLVLVVLVVVAAMVIAMRPWHATPRDRAGGRLARFSIPRTLRRGR